MAAPDRRRGKRRGVRPDVRALAAKLLEQVVLQHRSLDRIFEQARMSAADRSLLQELVTGSVRHYYSLSASVSARLDKPLRKRDATVGFLLIIGCYQLRHTRIPPHAAVAETVAAAGHLGKPWATGLVNQVLRAIASGGDPAPGSPEAEFDHPAWFIAAVRRQYPTDWASLLHENNQRAPMALRVNHLHESTAQYLERLTAESISARAGRLDETLILSQPVPAIRLPGYSEGLVSIQDSGAQLAVGLLDAENGERVLDACAAPGGKAFHIIERAPQVQLVAVERDSSRCEVINQEHARLRLPPLELHQGDATSLKWWDGNKFQRILIDAPCSGTGTLRRHPDIKLLKTEADLAAFSEIQRRLLANLWQTLAPGGRLLYCTCSVLSEENDEVIDAFMSDRDDAATLSISADWGMATRYGRQLLPEPGGADGFYFALLERRQP